MLKDLTLFAKNLFGENFDARQQTCMDDLQAAVYLIGSMGIGIDDDYGFFMTQAGPQSLSLKRDIFHMPKQAEGQITEVGERYTKYLKTFAGKGEKIYPCIASAHYLKYTSREGSDKKVVALLYKVHKFGSKEMCQTALKYADDVAKWIRLSKEEQEAKLGQQAE